MKLLLDTHTFIWWDIAPNIQLLPITLEHIFALNSFPLYHRDPFDRLLIAQARVEGATLLSKDSTFEDYEVPLIWHNNP